MRPTSVPKQLAAFREAQTAETFTPIYEATKGLVYSICYRTLGNVEDARDAFQATYARLLSEARDAPGAEPSHDIVKTVRVFAVREATNMRKRRGRRQRREIGIEDLSEFSATSLSADQIAQSEQVREHLFKLLEELSDRYRLPLLYYYFQDLSRPEIAEAMGISVATVHRRLKLGLRKLRPALERAGLRELASFGGGFVGVAGSLSPPSSLTAASVFESAKRLPLSAAAGSSRFLSTAVGAALGINPILAGICAVILVAGLAAILTFSVIRATERSPSSETASPLQTVQSDEEASSGPSSSSTPDSENSSASSESARVSPSAADIGSSQLETGATQPAMASSQARPFPDGPSGLRIHGRVVMREGGEPVEGATVVLLPDATGSQADYKRISDANGEFEFTAIQPLQRYRILQAHKDFLHSVNLDSDTVRIIQVVERDGSPVFLNEHDAEPITLYMETGPFIRIRVVSDQRGLPIEGALIELARPDELFLADTYTDADGIAERALRAKRWVFWISAAGYLKTQLNIDVVDVGLVTEEEVRLKPGGEVFGTIQDELGEPIEDALVRLPKGLGPNLSAEPDGTYRAVGLPLAQDIDITVFQEGNFRERVTKIVRLDPSEPVRTLDFVLQRKPEGLSDQTAIGGIVVDQEGKSLGAAVHYGPVRRAKRENFTDAEGRFLLRNQTRSPAQNHLTVFSRTDPGKRKHKGGRLPMRVPVELGPEEEPSQVRLVMEVGHWIDGRVVDVEGKPIPNVTITPHIFGVRIPTWAVTTDAKGLFSLGDLNVSAALAFKSPGYSLIHPKTLPLDQEEIVEIVMDPVGSIVGTVVDAESDKPVTEFNVKIMRSLPRRPGDSIGNIYSESRKNIGQNFKSDIGFFRLEVLVAKAPYLLTVEAPGYPAQTFDRVIARADVDFEPEELRLEPASGKLRGIVVDSHGRPLPNIGVLGVVYTHTRRERFLWFNWNYVAEGRLIPYTAVHQEVFSGPEGEFEIGGIPSGLPIDIFVRGDAIASKRVEEIELLAPSEWESLVIEVQAAARIFGTLDREVFPEIHRVEIMPVENRKNLHQRSFPMPLGEEQFEFKNLEPDTYEILLYGNDPGALSLRVTRSETLGSKTVQIAEGEDVEISFLEKGEFSVVGRIVMGVEPWVEGDVVLFSFRKMDNRRSIARQFRTDSAGEFVVEDLDPGPYEILVPSEPPDSADFLASIQENTNREQFIIADADIVKDFVFTAVHTLRGRILDAPPDSRYVDLIPRDLGPGVEMRGRVFSIGPDGGFVFPFLSPGSYDLRMRVNERSRIIYSGIAIPPTELEIDLGDIEIPGVGQVRVIAEREMFDSGGTLTITIRDSPPVAQGASQVLHRRSFDPAEGAVTIYDLAAGRVWVTLTGPGYEIDPPYAEVEIVDDQTVDAIFFVQTTTLFGFSTPQGVEVASARMTHSVTGEGIALESLSIEKYAQRMEEASLGQPQRVLAYFIVVNNESIGTVGGAQGLEPGIWRVEAIDADGRSWTEDVDLQRGQIIQKVFFNDDAN